MNSKTTKSILSNNKKVKEILFWVGLFSLILSISLIVGLAINGVFSSIAKGNTLTIAGNIIIALVGVFGFLGIGTITTWFIFWFKDGGFNKEKKSKLNSKVKTSNKQQNISENISIPLNQSSMQQKPTNSTINSSTLQQNKQPNSFNRVTNQQNPYNRPMYGSSPQVSRPQMMPSRPMSAIAASRPMNSTPSNRPLNSSLYGSRPTATPTANSNSQRIVRNPLENPQNKPR